MSNAITFQPNRFSMLYSAEKQSEEDLIKSNETDNQEETNVASDKESPENDGHPERVNDMYYKEDTCCDYMVNICQCTSWLCANLVSSMVLCFENCIDFVHTCKCNRSCCCDVCGGSEDSLADNRNSNVAENVRFSDLSIMSEGVSILSVTNDEVEPDSSVTVAKEEIVETDGEKLENMTNNEKQSTDPDIIEKISI